MKRFFSYIFTFLAVFLLSAVATVSLSISNDKYASSDESAMGQGSPLSFLTDILETFNNGKNIYVDAGIVVGYEGDIYQLHINGGLDIKDSNNIKVDTTINLNINGLNKEIDVVLFDNIAYMNIDNIQVKVDVNFVTGLIGGMFGEVSSETMDFSSILDKLDITGLMNAINNMTPIEQGTDTIYPLKEEGVIDAEIVMTKNNELSELSLREFYIDGAKITLDASFAFNNEKIQNVKEDDYLDIGKIYKTFTNLKNIDNKSLDIVGGIGVNGKIYNADIDLDFNREKEYYSVDAYLPEIIDKEIKLDYLNKNLYAKIADINIKLDEVALGFVYNLISESVNGYNIENAFKIEDMTDGIFSKLNIENIFNILNGITIDNDQICIALDLANTLGITGKGKVEVVFENYEIKELFINGEYKGKTLDVNVKINDLVSIPKEDDFNNYLDVRETIEKQLELFNITAGNLDLNASVIKNDDKIFDFTTEINAGINTNYYSYEAMFEGLLDGNFNVYYCDDVAYINYNDIQISCSKDQAEKLYDKYLKEFVETQLQDVITDSIGTKINAKTFTNNISINTLLGLTSVLDNIIVSRDLIEIKVNENGTLVDVLFVNGEINNLNLTNVVIGDYVININSTLNKNDFEKTEIIEEEYLDVIEIIENAYNLKDIKYGSINAIFEILQEGHSDKFDLLVDFNIEDLNNIYLNASVDSFGKYEIDANFAMLDNRLYVRLYDIFTSVNIDNIKSLLNLINIPEFNINSLIKNNNTEQLEYVKLISIIKEIKINAKEIFMVVSLDKNKDDTTVTIKIENNNIDSICVQNLPIEEKTINLEFSINRDKPVKTVEKEFKYLNIETFGQDLKNICENFGVDITSMLGLLKLSDIDTNIIDYSSINIDEIIEYVKNVRISSNLISVDIPASIVGKTGNINVILSLKNSKIEYVSITSEFGFNFEFALNDEYDDKINIYKLYNNVLAFKDLTYGNIVLDGDYSINSDIYNFEINGDFDFSNLDNIYLNLDADIWGALEADLNISLKDGQLFTRLFDMFVTAKVENIIGLINEFNPIQTETDKLNIEEYNIDLFEIFNSIIKANVSNNSIDIIIDGKVFGLDSNLDISIIIESNNIVGLIARNMSVNGHIINAQLMLDKKQPNHLVENENRYLEIETIIDNVFEILNEFEIPTDIKIENNEVFGLVNVLQQGDLSIKEILNYLTTVKIDDSNVKIEVPAEIFGMDNTLFIDIKLLESEIEYISVTDKNDIDISFAFNDKYKEIVNIYKLYENILNLQNIRYGNVFATGNYTNNTNVYNFVLDADFDFSDLENIYLNMGLDLFGSLELDVNFAVLNNDLYAKLFDICLSLGMQDINSILGIAEKNITLDVNSVGNIDFNNITFAKIFNLIEKIELNDTCVSVILNLKDFGIDSKLDFTIKLIENDVVGFTVENLSINGHTINLDLTVDKNKPEQEIETPEKYLDVMTLLKDVKGIVSKIGYELPESVNASSSTNINIESIVSEVLGIEINAEEIVNYIKTIEINSSVIKLNVEAGILERNGDLGLVVGLNDSLVDYLTISTKDGIDISLAFNNDHEDMINVYTLYDNILTLQDLRYGNVVASGNVDNYNFTVDADIDISNLENIYVNAYASLTGDLEADANIAFVNNDIFVRLLDTYLNISIEDIETLLVAFGMSLDGESIETPNMEGMLDTSNLTVENILRAIEKVEILKNAINIKVDARVIGLETKLDITVKLANNDVVGIIVRDLSIDGHTINLDLTVDKNKPEQEIETPEKYLDVMTLFKDVKNIISNFGVDLSENAIINMGESSTNINNVISDILNDEISASSIIKFVKGVSINSDEISLSINASVLEREGKLDINIDLTNSTINSVGLKTQDGINISFAFDEEQECVNIYNLYDKILALQELRCGNIGIAGEYSNVDNKYSFLASLDFDFSDLNNIYFNLDADVLGSIELDLSASMLNGNIFARIFDVFVVANITDIEDILKQFNLNLENSNYEVELPNEFKNITIENLLNAIEMFNVSESSIDILIDASIFGFDTKLDISIMLNNNDIVGLIVRNLNIDGHQISVQLELNKDVPNRKVENSQKYLDVKTLYNNIFDIISNFGFENIEFDTTANVDIENIASIVKTLLGIELNINDIVDYIKTIKISSDKILLSVDESIIKRDDLLFVEIGLVESKIDFISLLDEKGLNISFALNDNHADKINIYTLYNNILALQDLRYGNVVASGNVDNYNFTVDADIDISNLENIYVNAYASLTGDLEADANIAFVNNDIFVRLLDTYLNISIEDIETLLVAFGMSLDGESIETPNMEGMLDTSNLTVENILRAIEKVEILKNAINIKVDARVIGLETKLDITVKLANNDVVGIIVRDLSIDGHTINLDLTVDKNKPEQEIETPEKYLDVMTLLKDVKEIVSKFGYELPATIEEGTTNSIDAQGLVEELLGVELTAEGLVSYLKTLKLNASTIELEIEASIIERAGKLGLVVGLENSEVEYVEIRSEDGIEIGLALNDNYTDKVNVYTLYKNILALQDLRYGRVGITGNVDNYNFNVNAEVDVSDLNNIYANLAVVMSGALEVEANVALMNNEVYARLFEAYMNISLEEIETILETFGVELNKVNVDLPEIEVDTSKLTIRNILKAIEKVEVVKDAVNVRVDGEALGLGTVIDITIKLSNNDVVGLSIRDLEVEGHEINVELTVDKRKPEQEVENTEKYLDVVDLLNSAIDFVKQFGVEIPENIETSESSNIDIEKILDDCFGVELNVNSIVDYLNDVTIDSSVIAFELQAGIINREGVICLDLHLNDSKIDYVNIKDENGLEISLAFNGDHEDIIDIYTLYNNIVSLIDLREGYIDAGVNIYDNTKTIMGINIDGSMNVGNDNNYLSAFVKYVNGDVNLSANVKHLNKTFYLDYTDAKIKLTIESLLELIGVSVNGKSNNEVELIDLVNYLVGMIDLSSIESSNVEIDQILNIIADIKSLNISNQKIEIVLDGDAVNQDRDITIAISLSNNDISQISIAGFKIDDENYVDANVEFERTSVVPTVEDSEYFDAYTAYNSILDLFDTDDIMLMATGSVYGYNGVDFTQEFEFSVDARKNVINSNIGAYVLANIFGADYGTRDHKFQLNYINDELFINYNELKGHLAKTAITNTVLSIVKLLGLESGMIETLLGSVEDLFEGVGLKQIFKDISGIDIGTEIHIDLSILSVIAGISLKTNGEQLTVVMSGDMFGIEGDVNFTISTNQGKINTIKFEKLNLGGKYVDTTITVSPTVTEMPSLTDSEAQTYWDFNSLEELSNALYETVTSIETFKLEGNINLKLLDIEAADVPVKLYINRGINDKITIYGQLDIPTGSIAFKEYKGAYHIEKRTTYIYFDGEYLYMHRVDNVRKSILAWNKETQDHHFYGKITFDYFGENIYDSLDFMLGFSTTVSTFKSQFSKAGNTDIPPYVENIVLGYDYDNTNATENKFNLTLSGEALIQNDMIGDIALTIGKNKQSGVISSIYATMKVASVIDIIASFGTITRFTDSAEYNTSINSNISPTNSSYKNETLNWAF